MTYNRIKRRRPAVYAAVFCLGMGCLLTACGKNTDDRNYYDIEFHRGGRDARPENTLYAYQYAIENGASTIECDVQMTSDGQLVMSHNPVLNPDITTDGAGNRIPADTYYICDMTLSELQVFNVGRMEHAGEYYQLHGASQIEADASIPTLRDLFTLVRDSGDKEIKLNIETKTYPDPAMGLKYENSADKDLMLKELLSLVKEFGFEDRVYLQSFDWDMLVRMEKLNPETETIALYCEQPSWGSAGSATLWLDRSEPSPWLGGINIHDYDDNPIRAAHALGIDHVSPYWEELTDELTEEAHSYGMKVIPWTVNYTEDMEILYNMGVDGMITDRPWVLREFLLSKGEKVRPAAEVSLPYHLDPDHNDIPEEKPDDGRDAAY